MAKSRRKHKKSKTESKPENEKTPSTSSSPPPPSPTPAAAAAVNNDKNIEPNERKKTSKGSGKDTVSKSSVDTGTSGTGTGSSTEAGSIIIGNRNAFQRLIHYKHFFSISIFVGVVLGYSIGFYLKLSYPKDHWTDRRLERVAFPAELYYNILSSIREPVTCTSIIAAVGSMDKRICRIVGLRGLLTALFLNAVGAAVGILFVLPLAFNKPDDHGARHRHFCQLPNQKDVDYNESCLDEDSVPVEPWHPCVLGIDYLFNLIRSNVPRNLVKSYYGVGPEISPDFESPSDPNVPAYTGCYEFLKDHNTNNLKDLEKYDLLTTSGLSPGLWFVSFIIGVCAISVGEPAQSFMNLFISLSEIFLTMGTWSLNLAPIGICFTIMEEVLTYETVSFLTPSVYWFMITASLALLCFCFVLMPALYWIFTRRSPIRFLLAILPAVVTSFGTGRSLPVIPVVITTLEEVAHVDPRVVRYLTPILANTSYSGIGLYAAACIAYLALNNSVPLKFGDYFTIMWTCTFATIADTRLITTYVASAIVVTLAPLKLDLKLTAEILASHWIMGRLIVMVNITSDCVLIAMVNHSCRRHLKALTYEDEKKMKKAEVTEVNQQRDELYEQTTVTITAPELPDKLVASLNDRT